MNEVAALTLHPVLASLIGINSMGPDSDGSRYEA